MTGVAFIAGVLGAAWGFAWLSYAADYQPSTTGRVLGWASVASFAAAGICLVAG